MPNSTARKRHGFIQSSHPDPDPIGHTRNCSRREGFFGVLSETLDILQRENGPGSILDIPYVDSGKLRSYLEFLTQVGLLRKTNDSTGQVAYDITAKGRTFLKRYEELRTMMRDEL